jgi:cysteine desulfurase/selenocysteine lyase
LLGKVVGSTSADVSSRTLSPMCDPGDLLVDSATSWLYTGAEGPPLISQESALADYWRNRALGPEGRSRHAEREQGLRIRLAALMGLDSSCVALMGNASEALNSVALSLDLQPGDNVVINDLEYPSVVQPWLNMQQHGVEVRVAHHRDWSVSAENLADHVDDRTRVIAVSHVSYMSGWRHDLSAVADVADSVGAFVLVDATQSLGVVPVPGHEVDAVVASSYKWLLGGHGVGILGWNRDRRELPSPPTVGWRTVEEIFTADRFSAFRAHRDARRFEVGFPSYPAIYSLFASVEWLAGFPSQKVESHVSALTGRLLDGLRERGLPTMTSIDPKHRAGNVAFRCSQGEAVVDALDARDILCWAGDGRLRMSVHLFNGIGDVEAALDALDDPEVAPLLERS